VDLLVADVTVGRHTLGEFVMRRRPEQEMTLLPESRQHNSDDMRIGTLRNSATFELLV
jgi:hypothetical protein